METDGINPLLKAGVDQDIYILRLRRSEMLICWMNSVTIML